MIAPGDRVTIDGTTHIVLDVNKHLGQWWTCCSVYEWIANAGYFARDKDCAVDCLECLQWPGA